MAISHQLHQSLAGYCDRWVRAVIAITKRHFDFHSLKKSNTTKVISIKNKN
jgi:hypothetical protein